MNSVVGLMVLLTALSMVKTSTVPLVELVLDGKMLQRPTEIGNNTVLQSKINLKKDTYIEEYTMLKKCIKDIINGVSSGEYPEDPELADQCYKLKPPAYPSLMKCICKRVEFSLYFVRRICFYIMH